MRKLAFHSYVLPLERLLLRLEKSRFVCRLEVVAGVACPCSDRYQFPPYRCRDFCQQRPWWTISELPEDVQNDLAVKLCL